MTETGHVGNQCVTIVTDAISCGSPVLDQRTDDTEHDDAGNKPAVQGWIQGDPWLKLNMLEIQSKCLISQSKCTLFSGVASLLTSASYGLYASPPDKTVN